tara:strand:+ start:1339 stop:2562 length:1224 start_codon:yes stop_codon:yes gene_type:complete
MLFDFEPEKSKENLSDYCLVENEEISIPPYVWREIKNSFEKKEVIKHISKLIEDNKLPFPSRKYSEMEIEKDFQKLKKESREVEIGAWECLRTIPDISTTFLDRSCYFQATSSGLKVSDQHTHIERMECAHFEHKSPMREWTRSGCKSKIRYVLRVLWTLSETDALKNGVGNKQLRDCLRLGNYMASQFKPSSAKVLYNFFNAQNVLDLSAGWGDRLVGFHASNAESYIGIDPNSKLHEKYEAISKFCNTGKETKFICSPAEDADLTGVKVDFVFTSPPYFNIEKYCDEDTQSWKRYKTENDWLNRFFLPSLKKAWDCLEEGGRIAINIADKGHSRKDVNASICSPMLRYMESLGATYEGVIGYRMNKRPGDRMGNVGGGIFCEPIWVWSKGKAPEPKWTQDNFFGV